jgi:hypothetical protein
LLHNFDFLLFRLLDEKPSKPVKKPPTPPPKKEEVEAALGWLVDELITDDDSVYHGKRTRKHIHRQLYRTIRDPAHFVRCHQSEVCREHAGWLRHFLDRYMTSLLFVIFDLIK